jgi:hypothetical protein
MRADGMNNERKKPVSLHAPLNILILIFMQALPGCCATIWPLSLYMQLLRLAFVAFGFE